MTSETRVDVLAVLADIWHRGLCSENVNDFEAARAAVAELIEAAEGARSALFSCIDALSSDEPSDHEALDRITKALSRIAGEA